MDAAGTLEWTVFAALVVGLLAIDILYGSRVARSIRAAWAWSGICIGVALAFGAWVSMRLGTEAGLAYLTAFVVEESLSVDNLALFALVFSQTAIPPALQRRALAWGVWSALVMRAGLLAGGIYLLDNFHWLVYPFGAVLVYAAYRMWKGGQGKQWIESTCTLCSSWIARFIPIVPQLHGRRFVTRVDGKWHATPLLVALLAIESADLVFAIDSIPAVLAVTRDPFLVYSSNVFALLGMRALYSVVGDVMNRFAYMRMGLAALLVFVGAKLALSGFVHVPTALTLVVIVAIFAAAIAASRWFTPRGLRPGAPGRSS